MSRIAIIDTAIDAAFIGGKAIEHINLCGSGNNYSHREISHGTFCAMALDICASDYELVNIQIFKDNETKVFTEIELLARALKLCKDLKIDVVSLSAVSSVLSDSKHLYDISKYLARDTVIVSALDNARYATVPTSYPHVVGVSSDIACLLLPGEIAFWEDAPLGTNIYANCEFPQLREQGCGPSNSIAVPVVAAYINDLINQKKSILHIESLLQKQKPYLISKEAINIYYPAEPTEKEIPIVFLADSAIGVCSALMDNLYEKYEVQATALSLVEAPYDVRIKSVKGADTIKDDLYFMERNYKTDLIFIIGEKSMLDEVRKIVDVDITLICQDNAQTWLEYENKRELILNSKVLEKLHSILTE